MKSLSRSELYTPAASGYYSNDHSEHLHASPQNTNHHSSLTHNLPNQSCTDNSINMERKMSENLFLHRTPTINELNSSFDFTSKNLYYGNYSDRIAPPFPTSIEADQYKPPHQYYTSNCLSQSYVFSIDKQISDNSPNDLDQYIFSTENVDNAPQNIDLKLQRPSTVQAITHQRNCMPHLQLYASVPFPANQKGPARHVIVPCSFIQPQMNPLYSSVQINPSKENEISNDTSTQYENNPFIEGPRISTNFYEDQSYRENPESEINKHNSFYSNLSEVEKYDSDNNKSGRQSKIYANTENTHYNNNSTRIAIISNNNSNPEENYKNSHLQELKEESSVSSVFIVNVNCISIKIINPH